MYIGRRADGSVYGSWTVRQPNDADHANIEELTDDHPDVVAFLTRPLPVSRNIGLRSRVISATSINDLKAVLLDVLA